jgi:hypothetical protein
MSAPEEMSDLGHPPTHCLTRSWPICSRSNDETKGRLRFAILDLHSAVSALQPMSRLIRSSDHIAPAAGPWP